MRLPILRLSGLARQANETLRAFTDPATATIEVRATEFAALLAELLERRLEDERNPAVNR